MLRRFDDLTGKEIKLPEETFRLSIECIDSDNKNKINKPAIKPLEIDTFTLSKIKKFFAEFK